MDKSEIHAGYEFEEGMFARVRSWVDVVPWVRLTRVLRLLASPTHVGLVAIAWVITGMLFGSSAGAIIQGNTISDVESDPWSTLMAPWVEHPTYSIAMVVVMTLIWTPVLQFVARAGASLTATQKLPRARDTGRLIRSRWWKSYLVPAVPLGCLFAFASLVFLLRTPSLVADLLGGVWAISMLTGWLIGIASIPVGILAFGSLFAIPLGITAMVCEPDPDPIDSTSRGYEYLYRRPLSLLWYLLVAGVLVLLACLLLWGVAGTSSFAAELVVSVFKADAVQLHAARSAIGIVLRSWQITLSFGLLGGIYLLLRRDAGGQEVEDFWTPPTEPAPALPELPEEAYRS